MTLILLVVVFTAGVLMALVAGVIVAARANRRRPSEGPESDYDDQSPRP